jgi:ankyrin repeat protein
MKYTEEQKRLVEAAKDGVLDEINAIIGSGYDIDCRLKYGSSALIIAASRGHDSVVRTLLTAGARVNRRNHFGITALLEAADRGHLAVICSLLEAGADVNLTHNNGTTPLLAATMKRDVKAMKLLLDAGADPDATNNSGWSPKGWAKSEANPVLLEVFGILKEPESEEAAGQETPVEEDSGRISSFPVKAALWTQLMKAASCGDVNSVRRLVDEGVEINIQSPNGTTALIAAVKNGHSNVAFELVEVGADLSLCDQDGLTALSWAAKKGDTMIIEFIKKSTGEGDTPREVTRQPESEDSQSL